MSGLDKLVRAVDPATLSTLDKDWESVQKYLETDRAKEIPRHLYMSVMERSARRILNKLMEGQFTEEVWITYCEFFTHAMLSYGTNDSKKVVEISARVLDAVMSYPTSPQPLLKDYLRCSFTQQDQHSKDIVVYLEKQTNTITMPAPVPREPDMEYDDQITAMSPAIPIETVTDILDKMPPRLTFAHRNGVLHLKRCNPLQIPACPFVTTGYACDSCHIRNIRLAYQAMLYDETETETEGGVRSDAQMAKVQCYGFDMCLACAVYFYFKQRANVKNCLKLHEPFHLGSAAAVKVLSYGFHAKGTVSPPKRVKRASLGSTPSSSPEPPPTALSHRCSKSSTGSSPAGAVVRAPKTRVEVKDRDSVSIEVAIAPLGARPVVWVLPSETPNQRYDAWDVPAKWRESVKITNQLSSGEREEDTCMICLNTLVGDAPIIKTTCQHWFHVDCIEGYVRMTIDGENSCPICRSKNVLPIMNAAKVLQRNIFDVSLYCTPEDLKKKYIYIIVGALISKGACTDITHIAAAEVVKVKLR